MRELKLKRTAKYLTHLLRHAPEKEDLTMNVRGYVKTAEILKKLSLSMDDLQWIVDNDNKERFKFNEDKSEIRCSQGHSMDWIHLELKESIPPSILYHGTSYSNYHNIKKYGGISKMQRQYVHLSSDIYTALLVGKRHGNPMVIEIDTEAMRNDGVKFYLSDNNVWLTEFVSIKYFING